MKVFKFGGTSVGSPENMRSVMNIITDGEPKIVVLSAMSGTTNTLVEISNCLYNDKKDEARIIISDLKAKYAKVVADLYETTEYRAMGQKIIDEQFDTLESQVDGEFGPVKEQIILAQGELISTALVTNLLKENGHKAVLLPSLEFMRINADKQADLAAIKDLIKPILEINSGNDIYITQGFICRNIYGDIDNLQRGGSDYTATLIGAAIDSEEVQIWTDIDGFHNNDPRYVENTQKIDNLLFTEAAELAYFGAKILHPLTILPAREANIPVRLKNTMNPEDSGTLISNDKTIDGLKAVAAKDNIIAIKIRSDRMLMAYGFLRAVFQVFEKYKTSIDMITTSEVSVSLTIDNDKYLNQILEELDEFGDVEVDRDQTIVCIVGDMISEEKVFSKQVFEAIEGIPVRMISYGGSRYNMSVLIKSKYKKKTLQSLSDSLFND
ncbi:MAG: aspartate kinase [Prolixibacteraceae bacterium]|nr:aspartate kinase [Prolixibacteraceae bacterium]MBN2649195.1 aspartate kinase [Prolixibacteraceae bacterium]